MQEWLLEGLESYLYVHTTLGVNLLQQRIYGGDLLSWPFNYLWRSWIACLPHLLLWIYFLHVVPTTFSLFFPSDTYLRSISAHTRPPMSPSWAPLPAIFRVMPRSILHRQLLWLFSTFFFSLVLCTIEFLPLLDLIDYSASCSSDGQMTDNGWFQQPSESLSMVN